ncbi:MAG: hypothetical protein A2Y82_01095 [Candidatus Buchananbacteria bacterium RBG_13_36_9]|uniref:Uncharacterized protein n=1 Tax=Candidatus Buchananbacteria bacterium RBG_13_36_9 TaxID=1797530 RepID=A0A1G1XNP8_9BACT|nr:MAG: hypothetical protein A2Y82_01095 [Candidatus Buchananbacteria bacterium RBG_13_36_9]
MAEAPQKTIDCLRRYLAKVNTVGSATNFEPIMKFVGINNSRTIHTWLNGNSKPLGPKLLKVRYFLENQGNSIFELEKLDKEVYDLGKFIAFGHLDFTETIQELGYKSVDSLLDVLLGRSGISDEKKVKINVLLKKISKEPKSDQIPRASLKTLPPEKKQSEAIDSSKDYQEQISPEFEEETILLLKMLKKNIKLLNPRLANLISDKVSAQNRGVFRDRAGKKLVSELTSELGAVKLQLNSMCSETARNLNLQKCETGGQK